MRTLLNKDLTIDRCTSAPESLDNVLKITDQATLLNFGEPGDQSGPVRHGSRDLDNDLDD